MASTFSLAVVLFIFVCLTAGQDLKLYCPDKMRLATPKNNNPVTLTCTVNKDAYTKVCNAKSSVDFFFTNKDGQSFQWAEVAYDCNPPTGTFTTTTTSFPGEVKCNGDGVSYNMSFYPSMEITNGSFSCDVNCIPKGGASKPVLEAREECNKIIPVDPCGGCLHGYGCDESQNPPTCIQTKKVESGKNCIALIVFVTLLAIGSVILIVILCLIYRSRGIPYRKCPNCLIPCCKLCMIREENKRLRGDNERLTGDNERLTEDKERLSGELKKQREDNERLTEELKKQSEELKKQSEELKKQREENQMLREENKMLSPR